MAQSDEPAASAEEQIRELEKRTMQLCASFHKTAKVAGARPAFVAPEG
jgi:hypothetical protein